MTPLNVFSLFSGIGGLELGLERAGMNTVAQVEIDPYCRRVLAKHWPNVPRHDDVRTAADWWQSTERPAVDVICGGFPCQDISAAGLRAGIIDGEKSGLWAYLAHTVRVLRPRYVLVENVAAILVRGLDVVASDLAEIGYDLRWDCVPAAALGAPHRRDRWFGIAYPYSDEHEGGTPAIRGQAAPVVPADAEGERCRQGRSRGSAGSGSYWARQWPQALAHTSGDRFAAARQRARDAGDSGVGSSSIGGACHWATEPDVGRVADGVPARMDRLRALGNAVVPQVAEHVGRLIVAHASAEAAA